MSYQQDQKSAAQLLYEAQQQDFASTLVDYGQRRQILQRYDFSDRFRILLLGESILTWAELVDAISRIMKRLYPKDEKRDSLGEFRYRLMERGFSGDFIETFERVAYRQIGRKSDLITMHFSEDMSLRDLVYLEDSINKYYHEVISNLDKADKELRRFARENRIIKVRAFTHPGSVEIFIISLVVVPVVTSLGAMLVTNTMARNQDRRRNRVRAITTRFQSVSPTIAVEQEPEVTPFHESEETSNIPELMSDEQRSLIEIAPVSVDEIQEIPVPVPHGVQEIIDNMTSKSNTHVVAKSGDYVGGLENR